MHTASMRPQLAALQLLALILLASGDLSAAAGPKPIKAAAAAAPSTSTTEQETSCTPPLTTRDSARPFCFVPDTVPQAQAFLRTAHVTTDIPAGIGPAGAKQLRDTYAAGRAADSVAAAAAFFVAGSLRNITLAGQRVMEGTPVGYDATANKDKLLMYFHGGQYMRGSCWDHLQVVGPVAALTGVRMACLEYPLAPEHTFPSQVNSAVAVYKELLRSGYSPSKIALLGDSVGAGLAMSLLVALAREGVELPAAAGLNSPRVELEKYGDTFTTLTGVDPVLQYERNHHGSAMALVGGNASLLSDPLVSPLQADWGAPMFTQRRFPAVLIVVGLRETLLSSATMLYRKLVAASQARCVTFSPWEAMWHVWMNFSADPETLLPEAVAAQQEMGAFLRRHLAAGGCKT